MNDTLKKFLGQTIMMGIPSIKLDSDTLDVIKGYRIGNFIIFKRNVAEGKKGLKNLCDDLKRICYEMGIPSPFIAVDQEGGRVQRLGPPYFEPIMANSEVKSTKDVENQVSIAYKSLAEVGININLAPVLDMNFENREGVLKDRCYGKNIQELIQFGVQYIKKMQGLGIKCVAKHFPGIGLVKRDPHDERPVVDEPFEEIEEGVIPFREAINAGVFGIMTSHVIFKEIDTVPVTFSYKICSEMLRKGLGFNGILFSDDMEMGGILNYDRIEDAVLEAFLAGHDVCLICHSPQKIPVIFERLDREFKKSNFLRDRLELAIKRIIDAK